MRQGFSRGGAALGANRGALARQPVARQSRRNGNRNTRQPETRGTHLHGENTGAQWIEPTIRFVVEVGFGSKPYDATIQWADITSYVRSIDINRGRQDEFGTFQPGTASLTLSNLDNRFSAYYRRAVVGDSTVKPLVPIRVRVLEGGTYWHRFSGFVQGWPNRSVLRTKDAVVRINAVDAFGVLARSTLSESAIASEIMAERPIAYYPMQESENGFFRDRGRLSIDYPGADAATFSANASGFPVGASTTAVPAYTTGTAQARATPPSGAAIPRVLAGEFWLQAPTGHTGDANAILVARGSSSWFQFYIRGEGGATPYTSTVLVQSGDGTTYLAASFSAPDLSGHYVVIRDAALITLYKDGQSVATSSSTPADSVQSDFVSIVGADPSVGSASTSFSHFAAFETDLRSLRRDKDGNRTIPAYLSHYLAGVTGFGPAFGEKGGARIHRILDDAGWPDYWRDIDTGSTVQDVYDPASASALSKLQEVETGEQGHLFVSADGKVTFLDRQWRWANNTPSVTFGDVASSIPIADADLDWSADNIRTSCTVSWADGSQTYEDRTASNNYGELDESLSAPTLPTAWQAQQLARYRVRTHDETTTLNTTPVRVTRLAVNVRAVSSTLRTTKFYGLDLGQPVKLQWTPNGSPTTQVTANGVLLGLSETITPDEWTTELYVGPSDDGNTDTPYFVVGDATYGRLGTAAGNKIPY